MDFQEADRRYSELKRQYEAGDVSAAEFDQQREQLKVQDAEDRWWVRGGAGDAWHYYDGAAWVRGVPPGYHQGSYSDQAHKSPPSRQPTQQPQPTPQITQQSRSTHQRAGTGSAGTTVFTWVMFILIVAGCVAWVSSCMALLGL